MSEATTNNKKTPVKKATAVKTRKTATPKTASKKTSTAKTKTTAVKKAPVRKVADKKTPVSKTLPSKTAASKTVAKTATVKTPKKKIPTAKTVSEKTVTTPRKTAPKKPAAAGMKVEQKAAQAEAPKPKAGGPSKAADMDNDFIETLKNKDWGSIIKRGLFMVVFGIIGQFTLYATLFLAFVQFIVSIVLGKPNKALTNAINVAGQYLIEILTFLSFKSEEQPFPFGRDFPSDD